MKCILQDIMQIIATVNFYRTEHGAGVPRPQSPRPVPALPTPSTSPVVVRDAINCLKFCNVINVFINRWPDNINNSIICFPQSIKKDYFFWNYINLKNPVYHRKIVLI